MRLTRYFSASTFPKWLAGFAVALALAACGGGSGSSGSSSNSGDSDGSSVANQQPIAATAANTVPIVVGAGVAGQPNIPTVTVTVCVPGTSTCQTIDNIQLDTGSYGLRLTSNAATQIAGALKINTASNGGQLAECTQFADGFTWGTVRTADVKLGGETASGVPVQIIGDLPASTIPAANCVNGAAQNTSEQLHANGVLGIGVAATDCDARCESAASSNYYSCPAGTNCAVTGVPLAGQVTNPVTRFAVDNNGLIVQLPPLTTPSASVTGTLVFGIGTQSNNTLAGATRFKSTASGMVNGTYKNATISAVLDTGSNALYFADTSLPGCTSPALTGFYCPTSTQTLTAQLGGTDGATTGTFTFLVNNAQSINESDSNFALPGYAGSPFETTSNLFLFGVPFFYGRHVYFGYASAGATPYVAL